MEASLSHCGGGGGASSPPPFLIKTYEMVEDPATNHVVSWGPGGASFVVWNPPDFSRDLLPKYFKHNNFSSFIRQLNTYGFRKIDPERWEFANDGFLRGHTHLLKNIHRRKPVHSHSLQNQVNGPLAEAERRELEDEINRLKYEKSLLLADLQRQNQQQYGMSWQMQALEDRLLQMEQRQHKIVASLCGVLQRHGHGVLSGSLLGMGAETDHFSEKRRVPKIDFFVDDPVVEEQQVPRLQAVGEEAASMSLIRLVNTVPLENMEQALLSLEKLVQRAGHGSCEDMFSAAAAAPSPALTLGEMPMETDMDMQPPAGFNPCSSTAGHGSSSSPPAASPSYAQSPVPPLEELREDAYSYRTAEVDMNSDTTTADTSQDETTETGFSQEPAVVNDLFWERFLTEAPQYRHASEVQSGRHDDDSQREAAESKEDLKLTVDRNGVNHRNRVDQIIEQMGQLASAENASSHALSDDA